MFIQSLRASVVSFFFFSALLGIAYPAVSTELVKSLFPHQAEGSLIKSSDGKILGSELIGQNFTNPKYFLGRLSATGPVPYNAAISSGSNLGTANPNLEKAVKDRMEVLNAADPDNSKALPVDLVTASGSGLDPEISPAAASYQVARIARIRNVPESDVMRLVERYTQKRQFGVLGEPGVNVLLLNLALDGKSVQN